MLGIFYFYDEKDFPMKTNTKCKEQMDNGEKGKHKYVSLINF